MLLYYLFVAPINAIILAKTSHRFLGLLGVVTMSSCLIGLAYVPSIEYMYPVYGVGYGKFCYFYL